MNPYYEDDAVTIYHADCREILLDLKPVALTITSPPYVNARNYEGSIGWPTYKPYLAFLSEVLGSLYRVTDWLVWIAGYIWHDRRLLDCSGDAARVAEAVGFVRRQQVAWVKYDYAPQPSIDLAPAHELIQVLANGSPWADWEALRVPRRTDERLRLIGQPVRGSWTGGNWGHERFDGMKQASNVLVTPKLNGDEYAGHPAQFPRAVVTPWVLACSQTADTVFDPFAGSGTTLRVAKDLGRKAIGIEISERYCEMAALRMGQEVLAL